MHGLLWLAEQSSLFFFLFKKKPNCFSLKMDFLHTQIGCRHVLLLATNGSHSSAVLLPVFFHFSIQCFQSGPQFCGGFFWLFFLFLLMNISTKFRGMRLCPRLYEELKHVFSKSPSAFSQSGGLTIIK